MCIGEDTGMGPDGQVFFFGSRRTTIKQPVNPRFSISYKSSESQRPNTKTTTFIMKMIIAFAALVAVAVAAPPSQQQEVYVVKETPSDNIGVDGYNFGYELSNGESRQESGQLKNLGGPEGDAIVVSGSYSYVDPETNQRYTITYTADENGFRPVGDHIPA